MKIRLLATAVALTFVPALAIAGCNYQKQATMSCAEGTVYDAQAGKCIPTTG